MVALIGDIRAATSGASVASTPSGQPYIGGALGLASFAGSFNAVNRDFLHPFVPDEDITPTKMWYINQGGAGNIAMGIYDVAGNLLTDIPLFAGAGLTDSYQEVTIPTPPALSAGALYLTMINISLSANCGGGSTGDGGSETYYSRTPIPFTFFTSLSGWNEMYAARLSRTNAAPLATIPITGYQALASVMAFGVVKP